MKRKTPLSSYHTGQTILLSSITALVMNAVLISWGSVSFAETASDSLHDLETIKSRTLKPLMAPVNPEAANRLLQS